MNVGEGKVELGCMGVGDSVLGSEAVSFPTPC